MTTHKNYFYKTLLLLAFFLNASVFLVAAEKLYQDYSLADIPFNSEIARIFTQRVKGFYTPKNLLN